MRDIPPIAGAIIWARQIERQLQTYMERVEDVLGKGWEHYAEGQKLQSESNATGHPPRIPSLASRHQQMKRGRRWTSFRDCPIAWGRLPAELAVNFNPQIITLFKEVRNLLCLNFQVPMLRRTWRRMRRGCILMLLV